MAEVARCEANCKRYFSQDEDELDPERGAEDAVLAEIYYLY
jgi:hypothetical protein